jgi:threonine dehydrogenase-like Zn-dependent dehydrogenase
VAAGTGNVAIRAALAGADVIASDLTPENPSAEAEAAARGVELRWVEADAEALPFGDEEFDVVTSSAGAIFAPHHRVVADELLRVTKPGGTIGLIAVAPVGAVRHIFEIVSRFAPGLAEPGPESPLTWGVEAHVRELFGDRADLTFEHRFQEPNPLRDLKRLKAQHPVFVSLYRELAGQPARIAAFDSELAEVER